MCVITPTNVRPTSRLKVTKTCKTIVVAIGLLNVFGLTKTKLELERSQEGGTNKTKFFFRVQLYKKQGKKQRKRLKRRDHYYVKTSHERNHQMED